MRSGVRALGLLTRAWSLELQPPGRVLLARAKANQRVQAGLGLHLPLTCMLLGLVCLGALAGSRIRGPRVTINVEKICNLQLGHRFVLRKEFN